MNYAKIVLNGKNSKTNAGFTGKARKSALKEQWESKSCSKQILDLTMNLIKINFSGGALGKNEECINAPDAVVSELSKSLLNENKTLTIPHIGRFSVENSDIEEAHSKIFERASKLKLENTIFIGGDHSITYSLVKAFCSKTKNPGLVVFDAHPDLMPPFKPATHDNYLRMLIEEGIINPENVVLIGVRAIDKQELDFLQENRIRYLAMNQLHEDKESILHIMEFLRTFDDVYLSLDIDVADPASAPGTAYREVGGLTSRELLHCVQKLRLLKNIKWMDIVEINPAKDINNITVKLGAKLVQEADV